MICEFRLPATKHNESGHGHEIVVRFWMNDGNAEVEIAGARYTVDRANLLKMLRAIGAAGGS